MNSRYTKAQVASPGAPLCARPPRRHVLSRQRPLDAGSVLGHTNVARFAELPKVRRERALIVAGLWLVRHPAIASKYCTPRAKRPVQRRVLQCDQA